MTYMSFQYKHKNTCMIYLPAQGNIDMFTGIDFFMTCKLSLKSKENPCNTTRKQRNINT